MKKKYEKPQIYIEKFELAQHIAACDLKLNSTDVHNCEASCESGGVIMEPLLFIKDNGECKIEFEGYCYTNGAGGTATFTS